MKNLLLLIYLTTSFSPAMLEHPGLWLTPFAEASAMTNIPQIPESEHDSILTLHQQGLSARSIATRYNVHHNKISAVLKAHGVSTRHKRTFQIVPEKARTRVVELYATGKSSRAVASVCNVSKTTVLEILRQQGIKARPDRPLPSVFCGVCGLSGCSHLGAEANRRFRKNSFEKNKASQQKYRQANLGECRKRRRLYYERNKERENTKAAEWAARNKDRNRAAARARHERNPEKYKLKRRRYLENHRGQSRLYVIHRRALKKSLPGKFTTNEWTALCAHYGDKCAGCGNSALLTVDHIIPITKPGSSNFITNIQPLCGGCNSSKSNKTIDFRPDRSCLI